MFALTKSYNHISRHFCDLYSTTVKSGYCDIFLILDNSKLSKLANTNSNATFKF